MAFNLVVVTVATLFLCIVSAQISLSVPKADVLDLQLLGKQPEGQGVKPVAPAKSVTAEEEQTVRRRRATADSLDKPVPESQPEVAKPIFKADKVEEEAPLRVRRETIAKEDKLNADTIDTDSKKVPEPSAPVLLNAKTY